MSLSICSPLDQAQWQIQTVRKSLFFKMGPKIFKLIEPLYFHRVAKYRVADRIHLRQQLPTLDTTSRISWWPNRAFAFLLAISEIDVFCAHIFCHITETLKNMKNLQYLNLGIYLLRHLSITIYVLLKISLKQLKKQLTNEHTLFTSSLFFKVFQW